MNPLRAIEETRETVKCVTIFPRRKDEMKLSELIAILQKILDEHPEATIDDPKCEECDEDFRDIWLRWPETEDEAKQREEHQLEQEKSYREYELKQLEELKAKYEATS